MNEELKQEVSHVGDSGMGEGGYFVYYKRTPSEPKTLSIPVNGVRASVIFPTPSVPGYYLFMAEKRERNKVNKNPLLFLIEGEQKGYAELLEKFSDDAIRLKCRIVYCDQKETGFLFGLKKRVPTLHSPSHLPFDDDEAYGKILTREWLADESLEIPKDTILSDHLTKTTEETLPPGFHAVRQIVGGFLTDDTVRAVGGRREVVAAGHHWA